MGSPKQKKQKRKAEGPKAPSRPKEPSSSEPSSQVFPSRLPAARRQPTPTPLASTSAIVTSIPETPDLDPEPYTTHVETPGSASFEALLPDFSQDLPDAQPQDVLMSSELLPPLDSRQTHDPRKRALEALKDQPKRRLSPEDDNGDATQMAEYESPADRASEEDSQLHIATQDTSDEQSQDPRGKGVHFTRRVEGEIVEWLQANPLLYDRGHADYKSRHKKDRVLEEEATRLNVTKEQLSRWLHTKRTRYGKLTKKLEKSGAARVPLTDLDRWILDKFSFMGAHIVRQREPRTLGIGQVRKLLFPTFVYQNLNHTFL